MLLKSCFCSQRQCNICSMQACGGCESSLCNTNHIVRLQIPVSSHDCAWSNIPEGACVDKQQYRHAAVPVLYDALLTAHMLWSLGLPSWSTLCSRLQKRCVLPEMMLPAVQITHCCPVRESSFYKQGVLSIAGVVLAGERPFAGMRHAQIIYHVTTLLAHPEFPAGTPPELKVLSCYFHADKQQFSDFVQVSRFVYDTKHACLCQHPN